MGEIHDTSLSDCGFEKTGGKWAKRLDFQDDTGQEYTLFQIDGRATWSVDISKNGNVKTEAARKLKGTPLYDAIEAELRAIDIKADELKREPAQPDNEAMQNLIDGGFEISPEEPHAEYQEEPDYKDDTTPSRIKLSDEDLIKKLDEIIMTPGQMDKTLWVKL